jgi:glycine/D-amino acid oxidase-like deaminating enzyme
MPVLRLERPIWLDKVHAAVPRYPQLSKQIDVDVAIVGGGVTGAAVAWRLASSGLRVAVLEARRVGRGSTAASTALLMQEPDEDFGRLRERYGRKAAARIWQLSRKATRDMVSTLRRLDIRCALAERDSIYYTLDQEDVRLLRQEHRARQAAGVAGTFLSPSGVRRATGFAGHAAIRTTGNAEADPYKVCVGLLHSAEAHGAAIFERSPVHRTRRVGGAIELEAARASVRASHVVVATGYATAEFKPLIGRFRMLHTYVIATERLPARLRTTLGLRHVMLWDTERPYHYARWTEDHRLLLGGADRPRVRGTARRRLVRAGAAAIRDYFVGLYPVLRDVSIEYAWEGLFATTPDGLPYIGPHRRYPRHLFALGYGGNGMTFGFLAAQLIAEHLDGGSSNDLDLFSFGRLK